MAKLVKSKSGWQVRHGTNNTLLGSRKTKAAALKLKREIEKRNGAK